MRKFKKILPQIAMLIGALIVVSWWQTRRLPTNAEAIRAHLPVQDTKGRLLPPLSSKLTILYVWAPWCGVCHMSIDNAIDLRNRFPGSVQLVTVVLDYEDQASVDEFTREHDSDMIVVPGDAALRQALNVPGYPTYFILNSRGDIAAAAIGYSTWFGMALRLLVGSL